MNEISKIKVNDITYNIKDEEARNSIPVKTSELENDSGFLTAIPNEYVTENKMNEAITNAISGALGGSY